MVAPQNDGLISSQDRDAALVRMLNGDERLDVQLCEAVKLHMLASAMQLYSMGVCGGDMPLFAVIIFARESSPTPEKFMRNHLNSVGDTGGLEQVRASSLWVADEPYTEISLRELDDAYLASRRCITCDTSLSTS